MSLAAGKGVGGNRVLEDAREGGLQTYLSSMDLMDPIHDIPKTDRQLSSNTQQYKPSGKSTGPLLMVTRSRAPPIMCCNHPPTPGWVHAPQPASH
mmetsp:Transcript_154232/g.269806  ORF Transcript_154232/g.269806 Transcript_154232/m.269806 type:complete len:95 (-) Transcript_154232:298-582(-)